MWCFLFLSFVLVPMPWAQICFVVGTVGKRLDKCVVLRMGSRVERCRGSTSHGLRWAARQEALCFRGLMPNWYRLNESGLCAESVSRGLDGPAIIGTDKPCVEECTGKRFMGTQGKERRGRVGMRKRRWQWTWGMRRQWGEESSVRLDISRSWEICVVCQWTSRHNDAPCLVHAHSGFMGCFMTLIWIMVYYRLNLKNTNDHWSWVESVFTLDLFNSFKKENFKSATVGFLRHLSFLFDECLFDPLFQSDSLRLFTQESPAPLQTSLQYEGWRGIKREEG